MPALDLDESDAAAGAELLPALDLGEVRARYQAALASEEAAEAHVSNEETPADHLEAAVGAFEAARHRREALGALLACMEAP